MKLLYVAPFGLGQKTTVWARTLPLARELVMRGHSARIVIPPWDTPEDAGCAWREDGVELINVEIGGGIPMVVKRMLSEIERAQPDLIHIVKPRAHAGMIQWWLWQRRQWSRGPNTPLLLDVDDWEQAWAEINNYGRATARFLAWQEEWGIRHADGITAASRWLEKRAAHYTPTTPIQYLPNGVSETEPDPAADRGNQSGPTVLLFSRFVEVRPAWLADCWRWLHATQSDARLIIAGSALTPGREASFQEAMATHAPAAATAVEWRGFVESAQLNALYSEATCAIFPAETAPLQEAKCSVRLATTLLHGVPVIASAVGEQANYGANGAATLVPPTATPKAFADEVHALIATLRADPTARRRIVDHAREHLMQRYQWSSLAAQLEAFYTRMMNHG